MSYSGKILAYCCFTLLFPFVFLEAIAQVEGQRRLNGTSLHVVQVGKGQPLIVIHGGPGLNHQYLRPHLDPLSKNFNVVYYDQRACGKSSIPPPDSIGLGIFIRDLEALRVSLHAEKIHILAHSWGVIPALEYALAFPKRVNKLILSNPALLSREYDPLMALTLKGRMAREDSLRRIELINNGRMTPSLIEELYMLNFKATAYDRNLIAKKLKLNLPENFVMASGALFAGLSKEKREVNYYHVLPQITIPTLIVHGKADVLPQEAIDRMVQGLMDPTLMVFDHSGHFPFVEENEAYLQGIVQFLKSTTRKTSRK